jgi:hypothetical protein
MISGSNFANHLEGATIIVRRRARDRLSTMIRDHLIYLDFNPLNTKCICVI